MADKPLEMRGRGIAGLVASMQKLAEVQVLVGFPEDSDERKAGDGMTNAALAYIHDQGAPEQNIPQREFMRPGIESVQGKLTGLLQTMAQSVMAGASVSSLEGQFIQVGQTAQLGIQNKINDGVPPPLAKSTLQARARRGRKGATAELESRAQGNAPSMLSAKPLVDSGQMRNAVQYVIRKRGDK